MSDTKCFISEGIHLSFDDDSVHAFAKKAKERVVLGFQGNSCLVIIISISVGGARAVQEHTSWLDSKTFIQTRAKNHSIKETRAYIRARSHSFKEASNSQEQFKSLYDSH